MDDLSLIQRVAVWALPVLFAITVHESAHGWMARRLGDSTAYMLGRLTLNPIKHIDPIGTLVVPVIMLLLPGSFIFGWAKPVPVSWQNLKNPKRDMALVALAGPISNFLMAVFWALVMRGVTEFWGGQDLQGMFLLLVCAAGIYINTVLMLLNLLPIPPLDGGRVLVGILPVNLSVKLAKIEPYGMVILILLFMLGWLGIVIAPVMIFILAALCSVGGVSFSTLTSLIGILFGH